MGAIAIVDSSVVYGAKRILEGIHQIPDWIHRLQYRKEDDHALFQEFLHYIVLYDQLLFNNNSGKELDEPTGLKLDVRETSVSDFVQSVNSYSNEQVVRDNWFAPPSYPQSPLRTLARSMVRILLANQATKGLQPLLEVRVPWAYRSGAHVDAPFLREVGEAEGLCEQLLPLATFAWRGFCYAGIASSMAKRASSTVAYAAAPGRVEALRLAMDERDILIYERPRKAVREIQRYLPDLPDCYNFTCFKGFSPFETSKLNWLVAGAGATDQLRAALDFRQTSAGRELRDRWVENITPKDGGGSGAPITGPSASMSGIRAGGSVVLLQFLLGWPRFLRRAT
jgi:hypothetical protein